MALCPDWVQALMSYKTTLKPMDDGYQMSDSGTTGRAWVDGTLIIYDLEDRPEWLKTVLDGRNDEGDYERAELAA